MDERPIGMFDSGYGGLTVARAVIDLLPNESVVYVGDTERYPYGSKSHADVSKFSDEIARALIERHDVKALVVACNTASAVALDEISKWAPCPVLGVIEPGVTALMQASRSGRAGVIATVGTIASGAYQSAVNHLNAPLELTCAACPGFVEFVEAGHTEGEEVEVLAQRLLAPIAAAEVDALLLGCTHYPFLARTIARVLGPEVVLVSSADESAFALRDLLVSDNIAASSRTIAHQFFSSGDLEKFSELGRRFLGPELEQAKPW
jgi:glutamate racemase